MDDLRLLSDVNAEEAVIAAILLDGREVVTEGVTSLLTPEMFVDGPCRAAYRAFLYLNLKKMDATCTSVTRAWIELGWIDDVDRASGGVGAEVWLAEVAGKYFTAHGVITHARIVADLYARRDTLGKAQEMVREAFSGSGTESAPIYQRPEYATAEGF